MADLETIKGYCQVLADLTESRRKVKKDLTNLVQGILSKNEVVTDIEQFYLGEGDRTTYVEITHWNKIERYPIDEILACNESPVTRSDLDNMNGVKRLFL